MAAHRGKVVSRVHVKISGRTLVCGWQVEVKTGIVTNILLGSLLIILGSTNKKVDL